jgi:hypothetical protein
MASPEPKSQIVDLLFEPDRHIPSSLSLGAASFNRQAYGDYARPRAFDQVQEPQSASALLESCGSCVEDTQFVPIEEDTQRHDDTNFPTAHRNSQFHKPSNLIAASQAPNCCESLVEETQFVSIEKDPQAANDANCAASHRDSQFGEPSSSIAVFEFPKLLSRPNIENIGDPSAGFIFGVANKPAKGQFNRLPLQVTSHPIAENPSKRDKTNGKLHPNQGDL